MNLVYTRHAADGTAFGVTTAFGSNQGTVVRFAPTGSGAFPVNGVDSIDRDGTETGTGTALMRIVATRTRCGAAHCRQSTE